MSTTTTVRTLDLKVGDRVSVPPTLNTAGFTATVAVEPEPWVLSAGPRAGKQATSGRGASGEPLFTVWLIDPQITRRALGRQSEADRAIDALKRHRMGVTADHSWEVIG